MSSPPFRKTIVADLIVGDDGMARCGWGGSTPDYAVYHDDEWGRPVTDSRVLLEKLCLEGFQSGLSWLTILRKREAFREVFANFDPEIVANFSEADVERLLLDARIIRHRGKINATITNARATLELAESGTTLAAFLWSFEPPDTAPPVNYSDVPALTEASTSMSKALKKAGFKFVGPTTCYAAMQAMGMVNDHLEGCHRRQLRSEQRRKLRRPVSNTP